VLVDELDQMITKKQDVVYNFFNWPHMAHSRLIVIAIANTMDLPERELSGKIRSRLGSLAPPFSFLVGADDVLLRCRIEPHSFPDVHVAGAREDSRGAS